MTGFFKIERFRYQLPGEPDIVWDIGAAKLLVKQGHYLAIAEIDPATQADIMQRNAWDPEHLAAVDISQPGIAAPVIDQGRIAYVLIDGLHRNARAFQEGKTFRAYLLKDAASRACILEGLRPDRVP